VAEVVFLRSLTDRRAKREFREDIIERLTESINIILGDDYLVTQVGNVFRVPLIPRNDDCPVTSLGTDDAEPLPAQSDRADIRSEIGSSGGYSQTSSTRESTLLSIRERM
jgi:hypothetical protein